MMPGESWRISRIIWIIYYPSYYPTTALAYMNSDKLSHLINTAITSVLLFDLLREENNLLRGFAFIILEDMTDMTDMTRGHCLLVEKVVDAYGRCHTVV